MKDFPNELLKALRHAKSKAISSLKSAKKNQNDILCTLETLNQYISNCEIKNFHSGVDSVKSVHDVFLNHFNEVKAFVENYSSQCSDACTVKYKELEEDANYVTIMLFGRTKAGKSTTVEALSYGDGGTIGIGKQHTTKDIIPYYFPLNKGKITDDNPCLRIFDTPGIEGLNGDEFTEKTESFIHRADHIFFLFTDDKATSGELEKFQIAMAQNKSVTVLLNIKKEDADLDLLISNPDKYIFKENEVLGHKKRIIGYLKKNMKINPPKIIPFHARAAWIARSKIEIPEHKPDYEKLEANSRIQDVIDHILDFVYSEAVSSRIRSPREFLNHQIDMQSSKSSEIILGLESEIEKICDIQKKLKDGMMKARQSIKRRLYQVHNNFEKAYDDVPQFIDQLIVDNKGLKGMKKKWSNFLDEHEVSDCGNWFVELGKKDFSKFLDEVYQATEFQYEMFEMKEVNKLVKNYIDLENVKKSDSYKRAAIVGTATGLPVVGMGILAAANIWNPVGWVLAASTAGTIATSIAAEEIARRSTSDWEKINKQELTTQKAEITNKLRESLREQHAKIREFCENWIEMNKKNFENTTLTQLFTIQYAYKAICNGLSDKIQTMNDISTKNNSELIRDLIKIVFPVEVRNKVKIKKIVRKSGQFTKILLDSGKNKLNISNEIIEGECGYAKKIELALNGDRVQIVDAKASAEVKIMQALGTNKLDGLNLTIDESGKICEARIKVPKNGDSTFAVDEANLKLASDLLNANITLME